MNPGRFFIPNNYMSQVPRESVVFGGIARGIRSINWSKLLAGTNKTLNVMNQAIPLVKQAKPMINNVRSILKLAKAFNGETVTDNQNKHYEHITKESTINENSTDYPTFFA